VADEPKDAAAAWCLVRLSVRASGLAGRRSRDTGTASASASASEARAEGRPVVVAGVGHFVGRRCLGSRQRHRAPKSLVDRQTARGSSLKRQWRGGPRRVLCCYFPGPRWVSPRVMTCRRRRAECGFGYRSPTSRPMLWWINMAGVGNVHL